MAVWRQPLLDYIRPSTPSSPYVGGTRAGGNHPGQCKDRQRPSSVSPRLPARSTTARTGRSSSATTAGWLRRTGPTAAPRPSDHSAGRGSRYRSRASRIRGSVGSKPRARSTAITMARVRATEAWGSAGLVGAESARPVMAATSPSGMTTSPPSTTGGSAESLDLAVQLGEAPSAPAGRRHGGGPRAS
jgi:hypothetical protein